MRDICRGQAVLSPHAALGRYAANASGGERGRGAGDDDGHRPRGRGQDADVHGSGVDDDDGDAAGAVHGARGARFVQGVECKLGEAGADDDGGVCRQRGGAAVVRAGEALIR